jgi:beta-mannosidase
VTLAGFPGSFRAKEVALTVNLRPVDFDAPEASAQVPVRTSPGQTVWQVPVELPKARLWYTWDLGTPCLYTAEVSLLLDGKVADTASKAVGFRLIEQEEGWETYLNGIRIFQRGANYLSDQFLSTMSPERYERDVELLREANLNTVHPFCVVEKQSFYDQCDRSGILVYQDFPMWLVADNSSDLVRRATLQMRELVNQFGHHPSILVWNCGSQPSVANFEKLGSALAHTARSLDPTRIVQQGNAIIDYHGTTRSDPIGDFGWKEEQIQEYQDRFDWRVDTHQYYGWYYDRPMEELKKVSLEYLQLITEYGAQGLPSRGMMEKLIPKEGLFPPDWPQYTKLCFQEIVQFRYIERPETLDQFIDDSQAYQAKFIQYHTEFYRRHKFKPCNGAHLFLFNDCWPAITWSVVDYDRQPKKGFHALRRAMAPIQAFMEYPDTLAPKEEIELLLWVVNDYPRPYAGLTLDLAVETKGTGERMLGKSLTCSVAMNSLVEAGLLNWTPGKEGDFVVHLRLSHQGDTLAENEYLLRVEEVKKN